MNKRILVLEDDADISTIIKIILEEESYEVKLCADIASFKREIQSIVPDLFIFDVMLPDGNGLDLCHQVKRAPDTRHIPVVIISAHAHLAEVLNKCKPDAFIPKPFDIDYFTGRIKSVIN